MLMLLLGDRDDTLEDAGLHSHRVRSNLDDVGFFHGGTLIGRDRQPGLIRGDLVVQRPSARVADREALRWRDLAFPCRDDGSGDAERGHFGFNLLLRDGYVGGQGSPDTHSLRAYVDGDEVRPRFERRTGCRRNGDRLVASRPRG